MDMKQDKFMIILEKLHFDANGNITAESKAEIRAYLIKQLPDGPTAPPTTPTPTTEPIDTTGMTPEQIAYTTHLQATQNTTQARVATWGAYAVSYSDVKEWHAVTKMETKPIPEKTTGKGMCPFNGDHFDINTQTVHYGAPNTIATGSPSKLVCSSHEHLLNKRDQSRKMFKWAHDNSSIRDRKHKSWKVNEFPMDLRNRIILYLEAGDYTPEPQVQVYNQAPGQIAPVAGNPNPMGLQAGTPGVFPCAHCQALCQQGAQMCPACGLSPTTGAQKVGAFFGDMFQFGGNIAKTTATNYATGMVGQLPKVCPRCASQNAGMAVTCSNCGASLASHPPPPVQQQPQYGTPPQY